MVSFSSSRSSFTARLTLGLEKLRCRATSIEWTTPFCCFSTKMASR